MTQSGIQVPELRDAIIERDGGCCVYCGRVLDSDTPESTPAIDHLKPRCQGGTDAPDNLAACCRSCNSRKGGRTPQEADMVPHGMRANGEIGFGAAAALMHHLRLTEAQALEAAQLAVEFGSLGPDWLMSAADSAAGRIFIHGFMGIGLAELEDAGLEDAGPTGPVREAKFRLVSGEFSSLTSLVSVAAGEAPFTYRVRYGQCELHVKVGDISASRLRFCRARCIVFTTSEITNDLRGCVYQTLEHLQDLVLTAREHYFGGLDRGWDLGYVARGKAIVLAEPEAAE